jgi:hypothetical protein
LVQRLDAGDAADLRGQLLQGRDVEVPLEQRRVHADGRIGRIEQGPHRIDHGRPVRVDDQVFGFAIVTGHVHVHHALRRQAADEQHRVVAEVDAVHVDVVDVQMQPAVGFLEHGVDEVGLRHLADRSGHVERGVLDRDAGLEDVLRAPDPGRHVAHGFLRERYRQQVIELAVVGGVGQVLAVQRDAVGAHEFLHARQEQLVELGRSAQRKRQAVADERVALGEAAQAAAGRAAQVDPVLWGELEEPDDFRNPGLQRWNQLAPQAEARAMDAQAVHDPAVNWPGALLVAPAAAFLLLVAAAGAFLGLVAAAGPFLLLLVAAALAFAALALAALAFLVLVVGDLVAALQRLELEWVFVGAGQGSNGERGGDGGAERQGEGGLSGSHGQSLHYVHLKAPVGARVLRRCPSRGRGHRQDSIRRTGAAGCGAAAHRASVLVVGVAQGGMAPERLAQKTELLVEVLATLAHLQVRFQARALERTQGPVLTFREQHRDFLAGQQAGSREVRFGCSTA